MKRWVLFLAIILVATLGWYGFVSSWFLDFSSDAKLVSKTSPNIFIDSDKLNSIVLVFKSNGNLKDHTLHSSCETETEFLENYQSLYFFKVSYTWETCDNPNLTLKRGDEILVNTLFKVNLVTKTTLFNFLVDYPDGHLEDVQKLYTRDIQQNSIYRNYTGDNIGKYYKYLKWQRKLYEAEYKKQLVDNILDGRDIKYLLPVPGYTISNNPGDLPNASRWYRASYTDGIHHWWDVHAPFDSDIIAIDDGVVLRIVRWFQYDDLSKIKRGPNLTEADKINNLDILRWSQLWLKTRKWDVIFYSHLHDVSDDIQEGDMIKAGTYVGSVWVTWVPEVGYDHYHLHFAVQTNPYDLNKIGSYSWDDYMRWDWLFKWKDVNYIINYKDDIFLTWPAWL